MNFLIIQVILSIPLLFGRPEENKPLKYDIVIYGGTPAGIIAAAQSSRMGKKVALIEPGKRLGGAMSGGLGWSDIGEEETIGGLSLEFFRNVYRYYSQKSAWKTETFLEYQERLWGNHKVTPDSIMWTFEPDVAQDIFLEMLKNAPKKIDLFYNEKIDLSDGVKKKGNTIVSMKTMSGKRFIGNIFLDATYEADLMALAGISYHVGRESSDTYNEPLAGVLGPTIKVRQPKQFFGPGISPYDENGNLLPTIQDIPMGTPGQGDHKIQAYNFRTCLTTNKSNQLPIEKPESYDPGQYELLYRFIKAKNRTSIKQVLTISPMPNHKTDINDGGHGSAFSIDYNGMNWDYPEGDYATREKVWKDHYNFTLGLYYFLGHDPRLPESMRSEMLEYGLPKDEYEDSNNWTPQMYIRETRRMVGEYMLTQQDCQKNVSKEKSIGMASYGPDSHHVQRIVYNGEVVNEGNFLEPHNPYEIPLGVILPKKEECTNLIVPVCVSSSHIAFGSIRMEPVFMIMGQAAATAACLSIDQKVSPHELDFEILKEQLRRDNQKLKLSEIHNQ